MYLEKYSDFERLQYYVRRKSIFPSASNKAFESVFTKYFKRLSPFSNTSNIEDYKAAVNETFMVVIDQIENGKVIENLEAYIQAVFKRILRKIIETNQIEISIDEYMDYFTDNITNYDSYDSLNYSDIDLMELLDSVLTNKTEIEIIRLSTMGYNTKEIASLLETTPGSVVTRKHRALSKLRESVKK